jgi:hypothetical protein
MPRPKQFGREYADIFKDRSVVDAYRFRPTYPPAVFEILNGLVDTRAKPRVILDAGCGTGFLARELTRLADRVPSPGCASVRPHPARSEQLTPACIFPSAPLFKWGGRPCPPSMRSAASHIQPQEQFPIARADAR